MEQIDVVCLDPQFKKYVRSSFDSIHNCLAKKISWTMTGVIVAVFTIIAVLVYTAYGREQDRQCKEATETSTQVQELRTNVRVMQREFAHVREKLGELKSSQKEKFEAVLQELKEIKQNGGTEK